MNVKSISWLPGHTGNCQALIEKRVKTLYWAFQFETYGKKGYEPLWWMWNLSADNLVKLETVEPCIEKKVKTLSWAFLKHTERRSKRHSDECEISQLTTWSYWELSNPYWEKVQDPILGVPVRNLRKEQIHAPLMNVKSISWLPG